jgi:hypothetical protein
MKCRSYIIFTIAEGRLHVGADDDKHDALEDDEFCNFFGGP